MFPYKIVPLGIASDVNNALSFAAPVIGSIDTEVLTSRFELTI
jgi:hypothetical protein